jgi:carbon starvation protein CstA
MAPNKPSKMRISGLPKDYKYLDYLNSSLKPPNPTLDYFVFAEKFRGSKNATNNHSSDLLDKLTNKQSNKLTRIAKKAESLFTVSTNNCWHLLEIRIIFIFVVVANLGADTTSTGTRELRLVWEEPLKRRTDKQLSNWTSWPTEVLDNLPRRLVLLWSLSSGIVRDVTLIL